MRKYIFDRFIFLIFGIAFCCYFICKFELLIALLLDVVVIVTFGKLCKPILLLPFDLLIGKKQKEAYFSSQTSIEEYEFFKNRNSVKWKFRYGENDVIELLYPLSINKKEIPNIKRPLSDQKVIIEYFEFSKILIRWQLTYQNENT
ncbi:MAG: hypothetical protein IJN68_01650 [Clostridia bacterium]|nr:hypothetical protein [Clostridia bacterium]